MPANSPTSSTYTFDNFHSAYLIYSAGNEAPSIYHKWSALSVLSSAISRKVWWDAGFFRHYANLYLILVGDPGNGKSTAMKIGREIVKALNVPIAAAAMTKEAMTQMMGDASDKGVCMNQFEYNDEPIDYSHLSIFANEIVTTLTCGGNPIGMIDFFTNIWDEEKFEYKTKGSGTDVIIGPYITLLGCMTPEQTDQMMKESIISGGFSRRCLFVYSAERGAPVAIPMMTEEQYAAKAYLIDYATKLSSVCGPFTMTEEALVYYTNWYDNINYKIRSKPLSNIMKAYFRTKDCLLIKLAMLYSLGNHQDLEKEEIKLEITVLDLKFILDILAQVEPHIEKVFDGIGRNPLAAVKAAIVSLIDEQGGRITMKALRSHMFDQADNDEITKSISQLIIEGKHNYSMKTVGDVTVTSLIKLNHESESPDVHDSGLGSVSLDLDSAKDSSKSSYL